MIKRIMLVLTVALVSVSLVACKEETKYDIPKDTVIALNDLPYSEFIKLNNPTVTITVKDMGDMVLQLFPDQAPNTVANFIAYVEHGDYDGNDFHRVMVDFMIQAGNIDASRCAIQGEMNNNPAFTGTNDIPHYRGVISMARIGGQYDSGSSQFFIVHADSLFLDDEYAPFGGITSGFNILDFIAEMNDGVSQVTSEAVYIESMSVEYNGYVAPSTVCASDIVKEIPEETTVDLSSLPYSEYLATTNPTVTISVKDIGDIVLQLFPSEAPNTVANFIAYAERNDYEDNEFHRVMVDFMIQGGRLTSPSCTIQGEMNNNTAFSGSNDISHHRGVISMARVGGQYDSASSQFFIVHADSLFLDDEYAPFGGVVEGFNILDYIAELNDGISQVPSEAVYIENITVEYNGYVAPTVVCE